MTENPQSKATKNPIKIKKTKATATKNRKKNVKFYFALSKGKSFISYFICIL